MVGRPPEGSLITTSSTGPFQRYRHGSMICSAGCGVEDLLGGALHPQAVHQLIIRVERWVHLGHECSEMSWIVVHHLEALAHFRSERAEIQPLSTFANVNMHSTRVHKAYNCHTSLN